MIIGEIRRYLRDNNAIRVSRSIKDTAYRAMQVKEELQREKQTEPTVYEIAEKLDIEPSEVVIALESIVSPMSLYDPIYSDGGDTIYVLDQLGDNNDDSNWLDEISLKEAIKDLSDREKLILSLRFMQGKTQMEVSQEIGISQAQVSRLADYIEREDDYPIRNIISFGMNHHMWPRPDRLEKAFDKLDFFMLADIYMTDTSRYADLLLPVQTSLEREQLEVFGLDHVFYQGHVVEPLGEAWTDMDIITGIAEKLGVELGGEEPIHNHEEFLRKSLTTTGLTLEEVKASPNGLKAAKVMPGRTSEQILNVMTPSGKIEFVSELMGSCNAKGHEALPIYHDFREQLPMDEYPLILTTGSRKPQLFHSRTYRMPWLANLEKYPLAEVHPEDAKALELEDGEEVILRTPVGSMELILKTTSSTLRNSVNVYHGAGSKDINYILDDNYLDPVSGFPGFKSYCCRLEKKVVSHE